MKTTVLPPTNLCNFIRGHFSTINGDYRIANAEPPPDKGLLDYAPQSDNLGKQTERVGEN